MTIGEDYIGICIIYFCHDGKGRFLFNKRSKNTRDEHERWDVGGGKLEFGSTVEETLKKEIKEEYETDVLDYEFIGYRDVHRIRQNKKTHWLAMDFKVRIDPTKIKNGEPHKFDALDWFTLDALPTPLHSQLPYCFEKYKKKLHETKLHE